MGWPHFPSYKPLVRKLAVSKPLIITLATGQELVSVSSTLETEWEGSAFINTMHHHWTSLRVGWILGTHLHKIHLKIIPPVSSSIFTCLIKMCKIHAWEVWSDSPWQKSESCCRNSRWRKQILILPTFSEGCYYCTVNTQAWASLTLNCITLLCSFYARYG